MKKVTSFLIWTIFPLAAYRLLDVQGFLSQSSPVANTRFSRVEQWSAPRQRKAVLLAHNISSRGRYGFNHGGGRARNRKIQKSAKKGDQWSGVKRLLPYLFVAWLLSNLVLGGISQDDSFIYFYQSSYFETQVYGSDGKVDTTRKESVRTNMPSLLEKKESSSGTSSYDLNLRSDEEFERELRKEMDSMTRFERTMFDDFF